MDNFLNRLAPRPSDYGGLPGKITREDDAGNVYDESGRRIFNKFDQTEQPDSWLDAAVSTATAPAKLATALVGSLNPYGQDGWQVPPIISEPAAAFARSGELTGFGEDGQFYLPNVQNPQVAQDTLTQLMTVYGGNALNPLARAKSAVARDPAAIGLMDYGKAKYLDWRYPDEPAVDPRNAAQWKQWAETDTRSRMRMNRADAITQMNQKIQSDIDGIDTGAPSVFNDFTDDFAPLTPSETGYMNALIQSRRPEFDVIDGATKAADDARYNDLVRRSFERFGKHYEALTPDQTRVIRDGVTNRASFNVIDGGLLSDNRPSLMGSALVSQADALPMDQASRLQRARDMGFDTDTPVYHGTYADFENFDNAKIGSRFGTDDKGHFFTTNKEAASQYATNYTGSLRDAAEQSSQELFGKPLQELYRSQRFDLVEIALKHANENVSGGAVYPVYTKSNNPMNVDRSWVEASDPYGASFFDDAGAIAYWDNAQSRLKSAAQKRGHDAIHINDGQGQMRVVFDPSNIRSVNAAFDPARAGENGLLLSDNRPSLLGSALASGQGEEDLLALLGYR